MVLEIIGVVGLCLGLVVGVVVCSLVPSMTRIDCSDVIAIASCWWLLQIGYDVGADFRTDNRSNIIINNLSVAAIFGSAHVVGGKSTILDVRSASVPLMKHK